MWMAFNNCPHGKSLNKSSNSSHMASNYNSPKSFFNNFQESYITLHPSSLYILCMGREKINHPHIPTTEREIQRSRGDPKQRTQQLYGEKKMARKISMAVLFVVLAAAFLQSTFAATYTVGDSTGWKIPNNNNDLYENWADNKNFGVGDVLVFDFTTGQHDVAEVTEANYDSCNGTNPISLDNKGPARVTLNRTGDHYFICTFSGHCSAGQKLHIEVNSSTSTAPTPGSSPTTPSGVLTPPSSPSSASSLAATFSLVFTSILLVFLSYRLC
ncbi:hypothetical protein PTKIN_Ptkin19aG0044300 [Pterospermum kingtungense]